MAWLIYSDRDNLFWHNGTDPQNEGFPGWGSPVTASRWEAPDDGALPGDTSRWVREDSTEVTKWGDPDSDADHVPFPGVEIDYGEDGGVYINDAHGEVVMWTYDEIREDPEAWTASLHAVGLAARGEFSKIRALIGKEVPQSGPEVGWCAEHEKEHFLNPDGSCQEG